MKRMGFWVVVFVSLVGTLEAKALRYTAPKSSETVVSSSTVATEPSDRTTVSVSTKPASGPKFQQVEEPFGQWFEIYGKVEVIRPDRSFRIRVEKEHSEELENIPGVYIYRRGTQIPFIDLETGDWVTVRYKAKPI